MVKLSAAVSAIALVLLPSFAHAWGREGHAIVCELAYLELDAATRSKVDGILAGKKFGDACNWPDTEGEIQQARDKEHYINLPRWWGSIWYENCPVKESCLFTGIRSDSSRLQAPTASSADKLEALSFLGHWLGDIHQPLHVSFEDDRGGNLIEVEGNLPCSHNLHSVWDTCIPRYLMKKAGLAKKPVEYAARLHSQISDSDRSNWTTELSAVVWANESYTLAKGASVQYCTMDGKRCDYSDELEEFYWNAEEKKLELEEAYENQHQKTVETRLKQAGARLAALLEQIL
jgi:hypothetical protein